MNSFEITNSIDEYPNPYMESNEWRKIFEAFTINKVSMNLINKETVGCNDYYYFYTLALFPRIKNNNKL